MDFKNILDELVVRYPDSAILLTAGRKGAYYRDKSLQLYEAATPVEAVDSTGAGDTFVGFFVAALSKKLPVPKALQLASRAAALCVTKKGAIESIPTLSQVQNAPTAAVARTHFDNSLCLSNSKKLFCFV
eukprot:Filipodium_phascolosomae@DN2545_c0_g1_i2.p1